MKVYIAGPIGGIPDYRDRFEAAAMEVFAAGHQPINPVCDEQPEPSREELMRRGIKLLLDCDAILLLEGWENSRGAKLEADIAEQVGIKRYGGG